MMPLSATDVVIEQSAIHLHDQVDPLVVGRLADLRQRLAFEDRVNTPIAIGWQFGNDCLDCCHQIIIRCRRSADPPVWVLPRRSTVGVIAEFLLMVHDLLSAG
jgi:hypothetical protein